MFCKNGKWLVNSWSSRLMVNCFSVFILAMARVPSRRGQEPAHRHPNHHHTTIHHQTPCQREAPHWRLLGSLTSKKWLNFDLIYQIHTQPPSPALNNKSDLSSFINLASAFWSLDMQQRQAINLMSCHATSEALRSSRKRFKDNRSLGLVEPLRLDFLFCFGFFEPLSSLKVCRYVVIFFFFCLITCLLQHDVTWWL